MKKSIFTIAAIIALSIGANAQDDNSKKKDAKTTESKEVVNPDGTKSKDSEKKDKESTKPGTRMAINQKGLPGETKPKKNQNDNK